MRYSYSISLSRLSSLMATAKTHMAKPQEIYNRDFGHRVTILRKNVSMGSFFLIQKD